MTKRLFTLEVEDETPPDAVLLAALLNANGFKNVRISEEFANV